jgi:hypothetical protein
MNWGELESQKTRINGGGEERKEISEEQLISGPFWGGRGLQVA